MKYAVIIDAGSSGSRAFVYTWPDPAAYIASLGDSILRDALLPIESQQSWITRIQPGISSFQNRPKSVWKEHLKPLLANAMKAVPSEQHSETPIYFLATAGLRLLPSDDRRAILASVCRSLQTKTSFLVPECSSHVAMINGETEGLYGWLGLNYLVHYSISNKWDSFSSTYGFLDMGGASAQLAFAADPNAYPELQSSLHDLRIRTAAGDTVRWQVFVNTWLGHGANQAHRRLRKQIITESAKLEAEEDTDDEDSDDNDDTGKEAERSMVDPCLPKGAIDFETFDGVEYEFYGSGDFSACEERTTRLLSDKTCAAGSACLFEVLMAPTTSLEGQKFVGVSEYWYTIQDLFSTNGKFEYSSLEPQISALCSSNWDEIQQKLQNGELLKGGDSVFNEKEIKQACFKSAWVLTVLRRGLNFDLSSKTPSLDHNFQDTFQSASEIDGNEISWTLGRAVLYASTQIPPSSTSADPGYFNPSGEFITGGEVLSVGEIKHVQAVRMYSNLGFSIAYGFALLFTALVLVLKFRHTSIVHRFRRLGSRVLRVFRNQRKTRSHRRTASSIGYGMSYPHAEVPLQMITPELEELASLGRSSSHPPTRAPSRVGSRVNLPQP